MSDAEVRWVPRRRTVGAPYALPIGCAMLLVVGAAAAGLACARIGARRPVAPILQSETA